MTHLYQKSKSYRVILKSSVFFIYLALLCYGLFFAETMGRAVQRADESLGQHGHKRPVPAQQQVQQDQCGEYRSQHVPHRADGKYCGKAAFFLRNCFHTLHYTTFFAAVQRPNTVSAPRNKKPAESQKDSAGLRLGRIVFRVVPQRDMTVPVFPSSASAARESEVISAVPPSLERTKSIQDCTFGSMLPGAN